MKIPHLNQADRIKSKSKYWMMVTFITNGSILVLLILIPLDLSRGVAQGSYADPACGSAAAATATASSSTGESSKWFMSSLR